MNREEYLSQLRKYLKRLPKDDYEKQWSILQNILMRLEKRENRM